MTAEWRSQTHKGLLIPFDIIKSVITVLYSLHSHLKTYLLTLHKVLHRLSHSIHLLMTFPLNIVIKWFCCPTELRFPEDIGAKEVILYYYYHL